MKRPWMPFYVGDYLAKTSHLTTEQHGAYLLLIMHYWSNGGLPQDENQLMAIAKLDAGKWYGNRVAIAKFFDKDWRHSRIDDELAKATNISKKRALAGLKGAWSKHGKHVAEVWQMPTQSQSHNNNRTAAPSPVEKPQASDEQRRAAREATRAELEEMFAKRRTEAQSA